MATVHFTGTSYRGMDGATSVTFSEPGDYQVSDAKAGQLTQDFPQEFTQDVPAVEPAKAPSSESQPKNDPEPKTEAKLTKKGK